MEPAQTQMPGPPLKKVDSVAALMEVKARFQADPTSVSDEEIAEALAFVREARTAVTGGKKRTKKEAPTLSSVLENLSTTKE